MDFLESECLRRADNKSFERTENVSSRWSGFHFLDNGTKDSLYNFKMFYLFCWIIKNLSCWYFLGMTTSARSWTLWRKPLLLSNKVELYRTLSPFVLWTNWSVDRLMELCSRADLYRNFSLALWVPVLCWVSFMRMSPRVVESHNRSRCDLQGPVMDGPYLSSTNPEVSPTVLHLTHTFSYLTPLYCTDHTQDL